MAPSHALPFPVLVNPCPEDPLLLMLLYPVPSGCKGREKTKDSLPTSSHTRLRVFVLLLCNKLPKASSLKQHSLPYSFVGQRSELDFIWGFCSQS
jgi:hypothetical protein